MRIPHVALSALTSRYSYLIRHFLCISLILSIEHFVSKIKTIYVFSSFILLLRFLCFLLLPRPLIFHVVRFIKKDL